MNNAEKIYNLIHPKTEKYKTKTFNYLLWHFTRKLGGHILQASLWSVQTTNPNHLKINLSLGQPDSSRQTNWHSINSMTEWLTYWMICGNNHKNCDKLNVWIFFQVIVHKMFSLPNNLSTSYPICKLTEPRLFFGANCPVTHHSIHLHQNQCYDAGDRLVCRQG